MKNFTRTRKILLWLLITIVLVGTPFVVISGHLIPFRLPASKSYNSTVEITQLNVLNGTSTQPTTPSQENTSTMSNPRKLNRACDPELRWAKIKKKTTGKYERVNTEIVFSSSVNVQKKVSPMVRSFVTFFELYSIEDRCELSILMDRYDFQGVKIYPIAMNRFHVYFEGERFLLRKVTIFGNTQLNIDNLPPDIKLAQKIMKAYPDIVLYIEISFAKNEEDVSIFSEWILTK